MDDEVYNDFTRYLQSIKADMSLKLVTSISRDINVVNSSDELAAGVYGKIDAKTKQNFNQLASHTFRLTGYTSASYPNYLLHNIGRIEKLINTGRVEEANRLIQWLYDISEKIEDYGSQAAVLKIMSQQAMLNRSYSENIKLHQKLFDVFENDRLLNDFYYRIRKFFNPAVRDKDIQRIVDEQLVWFKQYHNSSSKTVSLLSRVQSYHILYYYRQADFFKPETLAGIIECDEELDANPFLVFAYLFDLPSKLAYLRLNASASQLDSPSVKAVFKRLTVPDRIPKYWNSYVNHPFIYSLAVQTSFKLSKYQYIVHKPGYLDNMPASSLEMIEFIKSSCEKELKKPIYKENLNDFIYLKVTQAAISLLSGEDGIKYAVNELEQLMITYQQIPFSEIIDTIFICLMIGYFALGKHVKCADTFKRYLKLSTNRVSIQVNEMGIYSYYYVSQWITTGRKQYAKKIKEHLDTMAAMPEMSAMYKALNEMVKDYQIPV